MTYSEKQKSIACADGRNISATLFIPKNKIKSAVMIAGATGIKKEFYSNFSQYLALNHFAVLTFDYRGIGESALGPISKDPASLIDWGSLDMPAALNALQQEFPSTSYHVIGHSAGGQLVGLMPNHQEIGSLFCFACSSGCIKNMQLFFRAKASFFLYFYIPISNLLFNHTKSGLVGMGEPLPKEVAKQWSKWCSDYGYVKNDFNKEITTHYYDDLNIPALWINAADDNIANDANVKDMLKVYTSLNYEHLTLNPKEHNLASIGHMKFFSRSSQKLWPKALSWLERHSSQ